MPQTSASASSVARARSLAETTVAAMDSTVSRRRKTTAGDDRLVVVVDEIVLSAVFFPSHVVDVSQGIVVGGAEPRADAAGQQNGHHLHAPHTCCMHYT